MVATSGAGALVMTEGFDGDHFDRGIADNRLDRGIADNGLDRRIAGHHNLGLVGHGSVTAGTFVATSAATALVNGGNAG